MKNNYCSEELAQLIRQRRSLDRGFCFDDIGADTTAAFHALDRPVEQEQGPTTLALKVRPESAYALPDGTLEEDPSDTRPLDLPAGSGARRMVDAGPSSASDARPTRGGNDR